MHPHCVWHTQRDYVDSELQAIILAYLPSLIFAYGINNHRCMGSCWKRCSASQKSWALIPAASSSVLLALASIWHLPWWSPSGRCTSSELKRQRPAEVLSFVAQVYLEKLMLSDRNHNGNGSLGSCARNHISGHIVWPCRLGIASNERFRSRDGERRTRWSGKQQAACEKLYLRVSKVQCLIKELIYEDKVVLNTLLAKFPSKIGLEEIHNLQSTSFLEDCWLLFLVLASQRTGQTDKLPLIHMCKCLQKTMEIAGKEGERLTLNKLLGNDNSDPCVGTSEWSKRGYLQNNFHALQICLI